MRKILYQLFVDGIPKAQPRPRVTAKGHVYNPGSADAWKEEIKTAFLSCRKPTITGPVLLTVRFSLPLPKGMKMADSVPVPHTKKPDTDNLLKAVMDSLTAVCVWKDDAQVFETLAGKYYTGKKTGAQIIIETF
jgi:Holliday junction resolvase RusA-like endonuclease